MGVLNLAKVEDYWYYGLRDTPKHTFYSYDRWIVERSKSKGVFGEKPDSSETYAFIKSGVGIDSKLR